MTLNDAILYLALSIPWGIAGWLAGFTTGCKAITWSRTMPTTLIERPIQTPSRNPEESRSWYRRSQTWIGAAVAAIGLFTGVQWYVSGEETARNAEDTKRIAECQTIYTNGFADALDARTKEAAAVADGQDRLWLIFQEAIDTAPSPELRERFRAQLGTYLGARAKSKATAAENPYPLAPRDLCK